MKKIAVLITVHNRKNKTLQCLENLFKQYIPVGYSIDVYLTNDGCTDGTREAVLNNFPLVIIVEGDGSLYWNRGMVLAWKEAAKRDYDFYLWLNDDTFLYDNAIFRLVECSQLHGGNSIIVGVTCAVGDKSNISYGGLRDGKLIKETESEQQCKTFNGNLVLVPRVVYNILGTNDPYYRHALGDYDYGLSATEKGIEIWTVPGLSGECDRHDKPSVWMDPSQPFKKRWKNFFSPTGNNPFEFFYFRKKHYGFLAACQTLMSNFIHFLFPVFWKKSYQLNR